MLVETNKLCNLCCVEDALLDCSQCSLHFCVLCDQQHHLGNRADHSRSEIVAQNISLDGSLTEDYELIPPIYSRGSSADEALNLLINISDESSSSPPLNPNNNSLSISISSEATDNSLAPNHYKQEDHVTANQGDCISSSSSNVEFCSLPDAGPEEELTPLPPIKKQWQCDRCSFLNADGTLCCDICQRNRINISDVRNSTEIDEDEKKALLAAHKFSLMTKLSECLNLSMTIPLCVAAVNLSELEGIRASRFNDFIKNEFVEIVDSLCCRLSELSPFPSQSPSNYLRTETLTKLKDTMKTCKEEIVTEIREDIESLISEIVSKREGLFIREEVERAISQCNSLSVEIVLDKLNRWTYESMYQSKTSVDIKLWLDDPSVDFDRKIRAVQCEFGLGYSQAINYLELVSDPDILDRGMSIDVVMSAAKDCNSSLSAKSFLCQECPTCYLSCTMNEMHGFMNCECKMCCTCFQIWLTEKIKGDSPNRWFCPLCESKNYLEQHVTDLRLTIHNRPELAELQDLFDNKVSTWTMQKDPYFRWCAHKCGNGFIADGFFEKVQCQICQKYTCRKCKKMWETEHDEMTCEEFEAWKIRNDPELSRVLEEIGIDCPDCNARFEFARGGCLHFTCRLCSFEFCCGCRQAFKRGQECTEGKMCQSRGLHAHHPRNCLSYLRDFSVEDLKSLLQVSNVEIARADTDNVECQVNETSESVNGYVDVVCKKPVLEYGLCEMHFKEFLVTEINRNSIDPACLFSSLQLVRIAELAELQNIPQLIDHEDEETFNKTILNFVQQNIPLKKLK